jgi:hypothetical protein
VLVAQEGNGRGNGSWPPTGPAQQGKEGRKPSGLRESGQRAEMEGGRELE